MRILAVNGSLRRASSNEVLLGDCVTASKDLEMRVYEGLRDIPPFDPDWEKAHDPPPAVQQLRDDLVMSDAVLFLCPEYGHSLPGVLKNAIDWLIGSGELERKRVAITAAVNHPARGWRGMRALRDTLLAVSAEVVWIGAVVVTEDSQLTIDAILAAIQKSAETVRSEHAVLYDFPISGNAWKVRTLLRRLGRPFEIQWVDLTTGENHQPWFKEKTPTRQVPVLELPTGACLRESSAILLSQSENTVLSCAGEDRMHIMAWLGFEQTFVDGIVSRAIFRRLYPNLVPTSDEFFDAWLKEGTRGLKILNAHLGTRNFIVAERFTIADIALYAYTHRAELGGFDLAPFPELRAWHERVRREPGVFPIDENPEAVGPAPG